MECLICWSWSSLHGPLTTYVKLRVARAPGMPGTFFPPPTSKETASYACAMMHGEIADPRWQGKRSRHSRRMRNSQFYVSGKRPIVIVGICSMISIGRYGLAPRLCPTFTRGSSISVKSFGSKQMVVENYTYQNILLYEKLLSNHQPHNCLFNRSNRRRTKKTSNLPVTGLCEGNSPVTAEFPAQRASNAEKVSIWWRHLDKGQLWTTVLILWSKCIGFRSPIKCISCIKHLPKLYISYVYV